MSDEPCDGRLPADTAPIARLPPVATVAAAAAVTALGALPVYLLGALAVQISHELAFGTAVLGISVSAYFAVSAAASVPAGRLVERVGAATGMVLAAAACTVSLLAAGLAGHWSVLACGVAVAGLSNSTGQVAANLALAHGVPLARQGVAFGIKQAAVPAATSLAGLAVPLVGLTVGWRWAFVAGAALPIGFAVWAAQCAGLKGFGTHAPGGAAVRARPDVRVGALAILAFSAGLGTFAANSVPAFLVDATVATGFNPGSAGLLLAVGSLSSVVVRVAMGSLVDARRFSLFTLVAALLALGAVGLTILSAVSAAHLVAVAAVVAYIGVWGWNGVFTLAIVRTNPSAPAAATGITQTGLYLGGVAGPALFGQVASLAGYSTAWRLTALTAALSSAGIGLSALRTAAVSARTSRAGTAGSASSGGEL